MRGESRVCVMNEMCWIRPGRDGRRRGRTAWREEAAAEAARRKNGCAREREESPRDGVALVVEPVLFAIAECALHDGDEAGGGFLGVDQASALRHIRAHPPGV